MLTVSSSLDGPHKRLGYAELSSDVSLLTGRCFNRQSLFSGQFVQRMLRAPKGVLRRRAVVPTLRHHVIHIVLMRASEEVVWVDARRIVALVTSLQLPKVNSLEDTKRRPGGPLFAGVAEEHGVALIAKATNPLPTAVISNHAAPLKFSALVSNWLSATIEAAKFRRRSTGPWVEWGAACGAIGCD